MAYLLDIVIDSVLMLALKVALIGCKHIFSKIRDPIEVEFQMERDLAEKSFFSFKMA